ncbi:MAG: hypothetical protein LBS99_02780, partial [Clostridiales bacterium]|nr:hypothetical protein [Clostridiales bacterium]
MRKIHKSVPVLFAPEPFCVRETEYVFAKHHNNETIFTVANGRLGARGFFEEGFAGRSGIDGASDPTTMINGVYEYHPYRHIWRRPGFPERYHSITPQVNPFDARVFADGELCAVTERTENYSRVLDMRNGAVTRRYDYVTAAGKRVKLTFERFADQNDTHLLYQRVSVAGGGARIRIEAALSHLSGGAKTSKEEIGGEEGTLFAPEETCVKDGCAFLRYGTLISKFDIACAVAGKASGLNERASAGGGRVEFVYEGGGEVSLTRCAAYYTNADGADYAEKAVETAKAGLSRGYGAALEVNGEYWNGFWNAADIHITGDDLILQGIRYSLFMLN